MNKKKKNALFLSIELVAIIVIIVILVAMSFASAGFLLNSYKVYSISKEVSSYSEAIIKFRQMYNYWPGDLPYEKMTGEFDNTKMKTHANAVFASSTSYQYQLGNGSVSYFKAVNLGFRQMAHAGLVSTSNIDVNNGSISGDCPVLSNYRNVMIPGLSFHDSSLISYSVNRGIYNDQYFEPQAYNYTILNKNDDVTPKNQYSVYNKWSKRPILTIGRGNGCLAANSSSSGAVISANLAFAVDQKLDDALPHGENSKIFSEGIQVTTTGWGCVGYPKAPGTVNATSVCTFDQYAALPSADVTCKTGNIWKVQDQYFNARYQSSSDDSGLKGCIMIFRVDFTG